MLLAQMLVEDNNGVVPRTFEDLEKLPGVGHKTASVVICTAFGYAAAPPRTADAVALS